MVKNGCSLLLRRQVEVNKLKSESNVCFERAWWWVAFSQTYVNISTMIWSWRLRIKSSLIRVIHNTNLCTSRTFKGKFIHPRASYPSDKVLSVTIRNRQNSPGRLRLRFFGAPSTGFRLGLLVPSDAERPGSSSPAGVGMRLPAFLTRTMTYIEERGLVFSFRLGFVFCSGLEGNCKILGAGKIT